MRIVLIILLTLLIMACLIFWPRIDLIVSGLFYEPENGFFMRNDWLLRFVHYAAYGGARILGLFLFFMTVLTAILRTSVASLGSRAWLFLFLALLIGPGLVANVVLKDHWGRARPSEITTFGGKAQFTPALEIAHECDRNCSFVSGDGAFGFYLTSFAYVVPPRKSRRYFWCAAGLGLLCSLARLIAGAHFFSDNLFAAFFMLAVSAGLNTIMFGWQKTRQCWQNWFYAGFDKG